MFGVACLSVCLCFVRFCRNIGKPEKNGFREGINPNLTLLRAKSQSRRSPRSGAVHEVREEYHPTRTSPASGCPTAAASERKKGNDIEICVPLSTAVWGLTAPWSWVARPHRPECSPPAGCPVSTEGGKSS